VHISAKPLSLQNTLRAPSAIAEVLVLTATRLSQLSFISIHQLAAASFAIEDWNVCAVRTYTLPDTQKRKSIYIRQFNSVHMADTIIIITSNQIYFS